MPHVRAHVQNERLARPHVGPGATDRDSIRGSHRASWRVPGLSWLHPLKLAGEELEADIGGAKLLSECRELDAAAEPLVIVHDYRDRGPGRPDLRARATALSSLGPVIALVEIFSAKIFVTPVGQHWVPGLTPPSA